MMAAIYADAASTLRRRKRQHSAFRPDYLIEVEQRWRALPATERLHLGITRTKSALTIIDVRVGSLVIASTAWNDGDQELDLVIIGSRLKLTSREVRADSATLPVVSMHAVSRRYRRGFRNDDAAVLADLGVLAQAKLPDEPTPSFIVAAPSGGEWRGKVCTYQDLAGKTNPAFAVRTFV